jgi:hypothetical protein
MPFFFLKSEASQVFFIYLSELTLKTKLQIAYLGSLTLGLYVIALL